MTFYQTMQLDAGVLKTKIRQSEERAQKRRYMCALAAKSISTTAFSAGFIAVLSMIFGAANSSPAVVIFCVLLSSKYVDFGYRMRDSLCSLLFVFLVLALGPWLAAQVPAAVGFLIHFGSILFIALAVADDPQSGNMGLYGFGYVLMTGYPAQGEVMILRVLLMFFGAVLCGAVFYRNHRKKEYAKDFVSVVRKFDLRTEKSGWQFQIALGVSSVILIAQLLQVSRFMWVGFACMSVMQASGSQFNERVKNRIAGGVIGSLFFLILFLICPERQHGMLGILGGLLIGFCATYKWKTVMNCLGALLAASAVLGLTDAVFLRIINTIFGSIYAWIFCNLFQSVRRWCVDKFAKDGAEAL